MMPSFGFDDPCIHGVDRITAEGPYSSAAITLSFVDGKGASCTLGLHAKSHADRRYLADLARAMNQVAEDHGRLTDAEREELLGEPLSRLTPRAQMRPPVEVREGSRHPGRFKVFDGSAR